MQRYRMARVMGIEKYNQVIKEDEELLKEFGMLLLTVDAGIAVALLDELKTKNGKLRINPWDRIEVTGRTWEWLRPLLLRLREAESKLEELQKETE